MKLLKFYGASDDLFEFDGPGVSNEISVPWGKARAFKATTPDGSGLFIVAIYAPDATEVGCWVIGVSPLDEGVRIPEWPMRFQLDDVIYSPTLFIEAPDDVKVEIAGERDA